MISILATLTLAGALAPAVTAERQAPPAPGTPKDFRLPTPRRFTLPNGLRVTLVGYGSVPKTRVELAVDAGNAFEGPDETWLADLTGALMKEGTRSRTAAQVAEEAAAMGGSVDVAVGPDVTEIATDVLSEFAPRAVRLLADVARHPRLPDSELARLKADKARELSIARSQPDQIALEKFRALTYPGHAYGRLFPASEAALAAFTVGQVRRFYDAHFAADRARLYVAGRFDERAVEGAIREALADWKRGGAARPAPPRPTSARAVHLVDRPGAVQSTIILGMPVVDPSHADYVPLVVTNTLLGGYFSSRITANIREDKGYTYSPYSQVSTRYRDAYWAQNADVTTSVTGPSLKEIFLEIDRLQAEPPPVEELKAVQSYLAGTFVLQNSSRQGIINQLEFTDLHGLPESYLTEYVRRVQAVTPETVRDIATRYVDDGKATIVVVGDRKAIEDQVRPFGTIM